MVKKASIALFALALISGAAFADVGAFTSFTTTLTPATGVAVIDVELTTTGGAPSSSDSIFVSFYFVNQTDSTAGWDSTFIHRDDTSNTFSGSYTFALPANRYYKWSVETWDANGSVNTATYNYLFAKTDSWYYAYVSPFFNSSISSASVIINAYVPTVRGTGTAASGAWFANNLFVGFAGASAPNLLEIPTLGEWGMLVLGVSLLGFGLVALRRRM